MIFRIPCTSTGLSADIMEESKQFTKLHQLVEAAQHIYVQQRTTAKSGGKTPTGSLLDTLERNSSTNFVMQEEDQDPSSHEDKPAESNFALSETTGRGYDAGRGGYNATRDSCGTGRGYGAGRGSYI
jgi:hypothetical protein